MPLKDVVRTVKIEVDVIYRANGRETMGKAWREFGKPRVTDTGDCFDNAGAFFRIEEEAKKQGRDMQDAIGL